MSEDSLPKQFSAIDGVKNFDASFPLGSRAVYLHPPFQGIGIYTSSGRDHFTSPAGRSDAQAAGWGEKREAGERLTKRQTPKQTQRAKLLRAEQTLAEGLLWSVLCGKQLCEMKFPRQQYLISRGWKVVRFTNDEVLRDVGPVLIAIASHLGLPFKHRRRTEKLGGLLSEHDPNVP
jgi:very-short-patch-repair endonuclease